MKSRPRKENRELPHVIERIVTTHFAEQMLHFEASIVDFQLR